MVDEKEVNGNSEKEDGEFGSFEEINDEGKVVAPVEGGEYVRARVPRKGEVIGIVVQRFGGNRMEVHSTDGKKRNCRIPGRFKKFLWLRPRDIVLITPWPDDDSKGDIIFKYNPGAVSQLRKKGLLSGLDRGF